MAQHKAEKILATHYQKILVTGYICVLSLLPYMVFKFTKSEGIKVKLSHSTTHAHDNSFSPPKPSTLPRITGAASSGSNNFECVLLVCRHSLRDYDQQQNTPVAAIRPPKILLPLPSESVCPLHIHFCALNCISLAIP